MKKKALTKPAYPSPLRLDIGCGPNKRAGFYGVDRVKFAGVDLVHDVREPWPFPDNSVDEVHCSHFLEHLTAVERVRFVNELYRVLKPGSKATLIVPIWSSCRAYGDPTHQWPPVSEFWFFYLNRKWREANAPHTDRKVWPEGYDCDFDATWGYTLEPQTQARGEEFQQFAMVYYTEARQDIVGTITRK